MADGAPPSPSISVLIIDGNDHDRSYFVQRLKASSPDYEIFQAPDGQSGLQLYESRSFDCVILELTLPDMSGFHVLVKLIPNASKPQIPVVVLTQLTSQALLEVATKNGAQVCLRKNQTSGDILDEAILKAISTVRRSRKDLELEL